MQKQAFLLLECDPTWNFCLFVKKIGQSWLKLDYYQLRQPIEIGTGLWRGRFLVKTYAKTKELGPIGGGGWVGSSNSK